MRRNGTRLTHISIIVITQLDSTRHSFYRRPQHLCLVSPERRSEDRYTTTLSFFQVSKSLNLVVLVSVRGRSDLRTEVSILDGTGTWGGKITGRTD